MPPSAAAGRPAALRGFLWLLAGCLSGVPSASAIDTLIFPPPDRIDKETFSIPTSFSIFEERDKEDFGRKETARFLMSRASHAYFSGDLAEALQKSEEGLQKGYYQLQIKRMLSRIYFLSGRMDSAISTARAVAEDTQSLLEDQQRMEYLEAVDRYLKATLDTRPISYRVAYTVYGQEKSRHHFLTPLGLALDRSGRILLASFGTNEVIIFSKGLEFQQKLSGVRNPFDLVGDPDGNIFVTSFGNDRIYRFDESGKRRAVFGGKGGDPGMFFGPEGLVLSPDNYLYVVDGGNHRIQKFGLDGKFLMSFGGRGGMPGQFLSPRSIVVQPDPQTGSYSILVLSQEGQLLQRFDRFGNFLEAIPTADLKDPRDMDRFGDRGLLISDAAGRLLDFEPGSDTLTPLRDERNRPIVIPDIGGTVVDNEGGLIYTSSQTAMELRVLRPSTLAERTLLNITDMDFDHYPYIGVTIHVTSGSGDPVTGLSRRNFAVQEDLQARGPPVSVRPLTQTGPMSLVIHLDPSAFLDRQMVLIRSFLTDLTRQIPAESHLAVRKGRKVMLDFTDNPYFIRKSLSRMGETVHGFLSEDIYESLDDLGKRRGRRNLLIITSRESDLPADQYSALLLSLLNRGISLFILHLSDRELPLFHALCRRSGGTYRTLKKASIPDLAFDLSSAKTASYFIVYASPYGKLRTNVGTDLTIRLYYLTDVVSDRIRYFAP